MVLNEEEPFMCIRCSKPFGTKSSVEAVVERLAGKHWMFKNKETADLMRMCDDCRIEVQAAGGKDPLAMGERPRIRTTEDYFAAEEALKENGEAKLVAEDFLKDE